jgi:hypothetical protein
LISKSVVRMNSPLVIYKAHCDCMLDDHVVTLIMEYDEKANSVNLTAYFNFIIDNYFDHLGDSRLRKFWTGLKRRISMCFWLFFAGRLPYALESDFLFDNVDGINTFIEALNEGKELLQKREG